MGNLCTQRVKSSYIDTTPQTYEYKDYVILKPVDTNTYIYKEIYYSYNASNRTNTESVKEYTIHISDLLERIKIVTREFIEKHCKVGEYEICENTNLLYIAYKTYLMRHLDHLDKENGHTVYARFFMNNNKTPKQCLMFLMQSVKKFTMVVDNPRIGPQAHVFSRNVDNYEEVIDFKETFGTCAMTISGIIGIRLHSFP